MSEILKILENSIFFLFLLVKICWMSSPPSHFQKRCYVPADYMHTECISLFSQKVGFFLLIDVNYKYDYL